MCSCPTGYMGDGLLEGTGCIDINECLNNNGGCSMTTQTCENTIGSRICVCNIGLFEDDMGNCVPPSGDFAYRKINKIFFVATLSSF